MTTPRLMYTLRTAPCTGSKELELYDEVLRSTLSPQPSTWTCRMRDGSQLRCQYDGGLGVRSAVMLAPSAYLASAASTCDPGPRNCCHRACTTSLTGPLRTPLLLGSPPWSLQPLLRVDLAATRQGAAGTHPCCQRQSTLLLNSAVNDREKARLRASLTATSGAWLQALQGYHRSACGWDDDVIRVAVGPASRRQPVRATHVHMRCPCGCPWHAWVGLQEKRRASPPPRPAQRRRVARDAACPGPVLQGTGRTQQVRRESVLTGVSLIPLVTRPLCDLGRHVP